MVTVLEAVPVQSLTDYLGLRDLLRSDWNKDDATGLFVPSSNDLLRTQQRKGRKKKSEVGDDLHGQQCTTLNSVQPVSYKERKKAKEKRRHNLLEER